MSGHTFFFLVSEATNKRSSGNLWSYIMSFSQSNENVWFLHPDLQASSVFLLTRLPDWWSARCSYFPNAAGRLTHVCLPRCRSWNQGNYVGWDHSVPFMLIAQHYSAVSAALLHFPPLYSSIPVYLRTYGSACICSCLSLTHLDVFSSTQVPEHKPIVVT